MRRREFLKSCFAAAVAVTATPAVMQTLREQTPELDVETYTLPSPSTGSYKNPRTEAFDRLMQEQYAPLWDEWITAKQPVTMSPLKLLDGIKPGVLAAFV